MTLVIDNIGLLVTNDAEHGDGALGLRRDVALVVEGEHGRRRSSRSAPPPTRASTPPVAA